MSAPTVSPSRPRPWASTPLRSYTLLGVTGLPMLASLFLVASVPIVMMAMIDPSSSQPPEPTRAFDRMSAWMPVLAGSWTLLLVVGIALMVVYILDVFRNPRLHEEATRVIWVLVMVLAGGVGTLVYWWMYLRPGADDSPARSTVSTGSTSDVSRGRAR